MNELNDIFNEFARAFVGTVKDGTDIIHPELLNRDRLDGSVGSLHEVDRYLNSLHTIRQKLSDMDWGITVLRAGAYIGEVIRHSTPPGEFRWVDYNDYMPRHPELQPVIPERTVATCAFLVHRSGAMSMPLNKVLRFITEGPENSVHYFASCDLRRSSTRAD
jgi:hypothetical protein